MLPIPPQKVNLANLGLKEREIFLNLYQGMAIKAAEELFKAKDLQRLIDLQSKIMKLAARLAHERETKFLKERKKKDK